MTVTNTAHSLHSCLSCPQNILKLGEEKETEKGIAWVSAPDTDTSYRLHIFRIA